MRPDTFGLHRQPVRATDKRREPDERPIEFYEPEEVFALAARRRDGAIAIPPARGDAREVAERRRADEQDAALFLVAAFTGLRMGELLALRWRNVDFPDAKLLVEASWSAGRLSARRSRASGAPSHSPTSRPRPLERLAERERFTGRDDLVFCSAVGGYLDPSAVRAATAAPRTPPACDLRFHDLRHSFGSLVIREFDRFRSSRSWATRRSPRPSATCTRGRGGPMRHG